MPMSNRMATRQPLFAPQETAEQNSGAPPPYRLPRKCSTSVSQKNARGRAPDHISEIKLHPHLGSQVPRSVELNLLNSEEGYEPTRTEQAPSRATEGPCRSSLHDTANKS